MYNIYKYPPASEKRALIEWKSVGPLSLFGSFGKPKSQHFTGRTREAIGVWLAGPWGSPGSRDLELVCP